jgi:DNA-binding transcriptional ArsR family regulator
MSEIGRVLDALADPTRRAMVERLGEGPMSVSRLAEPFRMTLTAVVQHLRILEEAGLVETEKTGRVRTCRIAAEGFQALEKWARDRKPEWEKKLDRLGDILRE